MKEEIFVTSRLQQEIEACRNVCKGMKIIVVLLMFVLMMFFLARPRMMLIAFCVYLAIIWGIFFIDVRYSDRKNELEQKLYDYKRKQEQERQEIAALRGKEITGFSSAESIPAPPPPVKRPYWFYLMVSAVDIVFILLSIECIHLFM